MQQLRCILSISNHLKSTPERYPAKDPRGGVSVSGPRGPVSTASGRGRSSILLAMSWGVSGRLHGSRLLVRGETFDLFASHPELTAFGHSPAQTARANPAADRACVDTQQGAGFARREPIAPPRSRPGCWPYVAHTPSLLLRVLSRLSATYGLAGVNWWGRTPELGHPTSSRQGGLLAGRSGLPWAARHAWMRRARRRRGRTGRR
jgi:hypothetical protein